MKTPKDSSRFTLSNRLAALLFVLLAFALYGNTIENRYCLDDSIVITRNEFTLQGLSGIPDIFSTESFTGFFGKQKQLVSGSRYRPLSVASFAVEQQFFHGNPFISHFVNVLLYGLTGLFLFLILKRITLFQNKPFRLAPLLASLIFMFHPVHSEVVANIKGRDELLAFLFSLLACFFMLRFFDKKKIIFLFWGALSWFLGLLSKENAIVFWILMPFILFLSGQKKTKEYIAPLIAFSISAVLFLAIRQSVIGGSSSIGDELMNNSFLNATSSQKFATIFYTLWMYIVLLFFPAKLTYDYYPYHISLVGWDNAGALAALVIYMGLVAAIFLFLRKKTIIPFALLLYLLPLLLVSNLFFPIGTFMSERFIYFSSGGFAILLAMGLGFLSEKRFVGRYVVFGITGLIFLLFTIKTIHRNKAWYDDYTLFTTDVKTSSGSAKSNCSAGGVLLESIDTIASPERKKEVLNSSIHYLRKAVSIHPGYSDAWLLLGNAYFRKEGMTDSVSYCYSTILTYYPQHDLAFRNMQALVNREKKADVKIVLLNKMLKFQPNSYEINYQLGQIYGKDKNDLENSISYLTRASVINPGGKDAFVDLGVAYGIRRNFAKSAEMLQKALAIDPANSNIYRNLGVTYQNMGQNEKAAEYFKKAESLQH